MKPFFDGKPKLKKLLKKFKRSAYFSTEDYVCPEGCPPDCKSRMKAFYLNNGSLVRMIKSNQIGNGGFGNVYKGTWHKQKVAFKCVPIDLGTTAHRETEEFLDQNPELRGLSYPQYTRLQKEIEEFKKPFSLVELPELPKLPGPGILKPLAFFRQQEQVDEGEKTKYGDIWWRPRNFNVYVYPLYDYNLYELHNYYHDSFTDEILEHVLSQCLKSLFTLFMNSFIHNDIKPQNFLVKFSTAKQLHEYDKYDLMNTKIMLTDFGLTGSLGGTPLFASPEAGFSIDT